MARAVFFTHKFFVTKGNRDELLAALTRAELRVTAGAFKGTAFVAEAQGEDGITLYPLSKSKNRNGLLQGALKVRSGVAGAQVKLSMGMPMLLLVAFAVGFVTQMSVYIFLATQGSSNAMEMVAPMLGASIAAMMGVMFWIYRSLNRQLEALLTERLQLQVDSSPQMSA